MQFIKKSLVLLAISVTLITSACAGSATSESAGQYIDDSAITTKVKAAIFNDPSLKSLEINVVTFKGEVQLSGFVGSIEQTNRAFDVAKTINGVTSVKNDMRVKGSMNPFYR
ncbi:BON domain-containing protein [Polynucleobacter sp. AP-RePozz3-80-G7]|uniref:BON domain-containing protein n=1 Tax=Polynucleobacter sp. AP-RePozz3-80-G7 TaxID=2689105 RepID=UPI001D5E47B5|nr:BON domain-containing protein [Polynucleobacter sp. AP-RePozz3-80-G7]MBU3639828.1 BON domain-containing protein [Polynucleobacter sp. AP-RePozz3-80-G7]